MSFDSPDRARSRQPSTPETYDVFISHNSREKAWVREVTALLRSCGLKVFFDEDNIAPGKNTVIEIGRAVAASKHVVLVLTPSALASRWVAMERVIATYADPDANKNILIPVLLEPVAADKIPPELRPLNRVDLTDPGSRDAQFRRLLRHLGIEQPSACPPWAAEDAEVAVPLRIADIEDVLAWGWDGGTLLDELIKLDFETIDGLRDTHEGDIRQWAPVFMDHPDTWRLLICGDANVVGYWHFVPLFDEQMARAAAGDLLDSEISADTVRFFELPGEYDLYFVSFCIKAQYRGSTAAPRLAKSLFEVVRRLSSRDIFVRDVWANAYTQSGMSVCRSFGMKPVARHKEQGQIFHGRFADLLRAYPALVSPALASAYVNRAADKGS